jgi:protein-S-isoprenylcysteine O-methyltransferase Ste14
MACRGAGLLLIALGAWIRIAAIRELRKVGVSDSQFFHVRIPKHYTNEGPYTWSDHPCYVGSLLMGAGVGMIFLGWGGVVLPLMAWPFYEDRIRLERAIRQRAREIGVCGA